MDPSTRIISHMNKDHQLAVIDYLVVYGDVKPSDLVQTSALISSVSEKSMTIDYESKNAGKKSTTFNWEDLQEDENVKVESMKDLKSKLVAMAKYAAKKQGYSHIRVTLYPDLDLNTLFMFSIGGLFMLAVIDLLLMKALFAKDPITSAITAYFPGPVWSVLNFAGDNIKLITFTTYLIHIFEVAFATVPRIIKYRVPIPQAVCWLVVNFIEGFFAIIKFNKLTEQ